MPFVSLQLPPGIERNATPYDTPGQFWDMNLVRWQSGTLRPVGGWQRATASPLDTASRHISMWRDNNNSRRVLIGTDAKLYSDNGSAFVDVTPTGFVALDQLGTSGGYGTVTYGTQTYGTARTGYTNVFSPVPFWSVANWGQDAIVTANSDGRLFYYNSGNTSSAPTVISTAPAGNTSVVVTDERHVMAIGCGGNQRRVGWSSRESTTDWDFTSSVNTAGFLDLDCRTPLQRGIKVREGTLILSLSEAYLARYVGSPYIYGIDRIADTTLLGPNAVSAFNGKAFWAGRNGFWKYEGGFITQLDCPIANDVFGNIDPTYGPRRSFAVHNGTFPEVWFFYPQNGETECSRYIAWNYAEGGGFWFWGSLSRTSGVSGETYPRPFLGGTDKNIYEHETGWTDAGVTRVGSIYAETGMLPLTNGDRGIVVNNILPANGHGYNSLQIKFYSRQTPEGQEKTWGAYHPRSNGYTDCRVSARDIRMRIEATADTDWSIGKIRFDVQPGTGR